MKVGDLVKLKSLNLGLADNPLVGIIINIEHRLIHSINDYPRSRVFVTICWSDSRINNWAEEELEVVNGSR